MTKTIKANNHIFYLDNKVRLSPSGRPFRHSGVELLLTEQALWIDGVYMHPTIYSFIFLDNKGGFLRLKFDAKEKFEKIVVD